MWVAWMALAGCGSADREGCDRLVVCATVANPFLVTAYREAYEPDGTCFDAYSDEECEGQCVQILTSLFVEYDEPACDPEPVTGEILLPESQFWSEFVDRYCAAQEDCDPDRRCYASEGLTYLARLGV